MPDNWIQTFSGKAFFPLIPDASDICLRDIAHHLALVNRWTGASRVPISVAEHSVIVSERAEQLAMARDPDQLPLPFRGAYGRVIYNKMVGQWGLLHDASEAYIADVASPLKHAPEMAAYRAAEKRIMNVIMVWAQLPQDQPSEVTVADADSLSAEARLVMQPMRPGWHLAQPVDLPLEPAGLDWRAAEQLFLDRACKLGMRAEAI